MIEPVRKLNVIGCSSCGKDHEQVEVFHDVRGQFFTCGDRRVDVREVDELEAHRLRMQALMREAIAPLLERLDAAEQNLAADRVEDGQQDAQRLAEARARFRASLVVELLSGQCASNTFNWNNERAEVLNALAVVDTVLDTCGVTPPATLTPAPEHA